MNLVSNTTLDHAWERHFVDSAQLLPFITHRPGRILDMGSGAGFPGLVVSLLTDRHVDLVESDRKKCLFLKEVIRQTHANATVHNTRLEECNLRDIDVIISRALANMSDLIRLAQPLKAHNAVLLFLKGQNINNEIAEARKKWHFEYEIYQGENSPCSTVIKVWDTNDNSICDS